jgi:hypothetical protein
LIWSAQPIMSPAVASRIMIRLPRGLGQLSLTTPLTIQKIMSAGAPWQKIIAPDA